jgi:hypothetical protein
MDLHTDPVNLSTDQMKALRIIIFNKMISKNDPRYKAACALNNKYQLHKIDLFNTRIANQDLDFLFKGWDKILLKKTLQFTHYRNKRESYYMPNFGKKIVLPNAFSSQNKRCFIAYNA